MKKFLAIFLLVLFLPFVNISATTYDDTGNAGYNPTESKETELAGGVTHIKAKGYTIRNNQDYSQQVNVLQMKTRENAKVATWAIRNSSGTGYTRNTVATIAKDYEKHHPGWKVVGAMNADQYYFGYGNGLTADGTAQFQPQPYYPMIADYEKWFAITATPYNNGHVVGFLNDGSEDQLLYQNAGWNYKGEDKVEIAGLFLTITKEDATYRFEIENFNKKPNDGESSIFSPYYVDKKVPDLPVTGDLFIVEEADLAYTSNSKTYTAVKPHNENAFFGKGKITTRINSSVKLKQGQFAIETKNPELLEVLEVGDYVLAQFEFEGKLNEVESAIGFHKIMRVDDKDKPMTGSYNETLYPRAMFGRKSDGTIVFVTVDGRQATKGMNGVNMEEANAILKHYGVVEAYQLDGGGSVTMVVRNGDKFETVNSPSDGQDRAVLSALLFVVKDVEVENNIEVTSNKISFDINILDPKVSKLYINFNGETKEIKDGKIEFTNLTPNTPYTYQFISEKDGELIPDVEVHTIYTAKREPKFNYLSLFDNGDNILCDAIFDDLDGAVTYIRVTIGDESKNIFSKPINFQKTQDLDLRNIQITYRYDLNNGKGETTIDVNKANVCADLKVVMDSIRNLISNEIKSIYN